MFQPNSTPSLNLFQTQQQPSMNDASRLFSNPNYPTNPNNPNTMNTGNSGMTLRSGATTNMFAQPTNTNNTNIFASNMNSKNLFTSQNNNNTQNPNNQTFSQNSIRPNDFFSSMGGGNSYNNRAPSSFGSIDEKFNKINYKYLRNNEFEKNLYLGSILAQNQHKDKTLEMVRLEDYSLIKTLNVPDEIKGIIKRCVSEKAFSELSIREDVRAQIMGSSNSYNIVGGGGGGGGGTGINPNIFSTNTNSYMNQQNPQSSNNLYPSNTNTNNPLSFLNNTNTNTNNNQATSFFQKPTLSNNNNIFGQPNTGQNNNLFTQNPSSMNLFQNPSSAPQLNTNSQNLFQNPNAQNFNLNSSGLFKPPQNPNNSMVFSSHLHSSPQKLYHPQHNYNTAQNFYNPQPQPQPQMNYMQNYSMSQMSQPNYSMMNQSNYMTNIPQTSQPNYYPTPSDQYPPYEQSQSQQHQPIYPYNPYPSSNSINFSNSNDFAFENSDKSFLFAKSKAVNNISPYREMKNRNESHPADIKNFMRSPWGLKSMLYDVEEDYSLKDIPENISGNYFRDKKMYKNTDENLRSRVMLNQKKKETTAKITIEDEDFDVCFQQRPRRYLESLEKERFHKKTRSVSPANVIEMNNQIIDHNSRNSFLNYHLFTSSNSILVNLKVDFEDGAVKNYPLKLSKETVLKNLKDFIFKKRCKFDEKLTEELMKHSFFQVKSSLISEDKTVIQAGLNNDDTIMLGLDKIGLELYYKDKNINLPENINIQEITIINQSYLPILTKKDYCTIPRFSELSKYNEEALQKVDGFTIYNQNGMIEFEDLTDLTYQNLDEIVDINEKYIEVYPDDIFNDKAKKKPAVGEKLNKPAILTFRKCAFWKNLKSQEVNHEKILKSLNEMAKKKDCEIVKYNPEIGEWKLRVKHFTKYGGIIEEEDSNPGDEQQSDSESIMQSGKMKFSPERPEESESEDQNQSKPKASPRTKHFSDFPVIHEEIDDENIGSQEEMLNRKEKDIFSDNEEFKMNFDQNEESLNNQSNEDFVNEKRFKYSPDAFEIIASSPDSFGKKQLSNQKNFENEQQRQDFSSFKNLDDYPVDNETFEKDDLFEEETFVFQINGFKKNDKKTFQKLSFMENKVRGNLNNQPKEYYQNCSFRPSWCCDGFCSLGGNKYGNYSIDVNKVIIYQEFFQKTENCTNDYENYRNITNEYNKNLTILFKVISESCDIGSVEKNIENLSFVEKKENNYAWPSKQQFLQKIFLYMNKYCKTLNFKKDYLFKQKFYQDELFNIGLMNILFGNAKIDIIRFFKMIQNNTTTDQKLFNHLYENIEKFQRDNRKDDYFRKILLNKYLEAKSYKNVLGELNFFFKNNYKIQKEEEKTRYFQEIVKIYLSGNQICEASEFARKAGYPKLSLCLSSLSSKNTRAIINDGYVLAKQCNALEEFVFNDIYKIAIGDISAFDELDVTRWLGVHFWYSPLKEENILEIFEEFLKKKQFLTQFDKNKSYFEYTCILLAFYIRQNMSLFKNQNIKSMESFNILSDPLKILHPSSYGNNCLDRKILWIFTQFLFNELQQGNLFESFIDSKIDFGQFYLKLTRNFVTQLEILGLWDQAVILLIHVPQTFLRNQTKDKWIKNIIHRNYLEDDDLLNFKEKKTKLLKFSITEKYFYEANSFYYCYNFNWKSAVTAFYKSGSLIECNQILRNNYISEAIIMILECKDLIYQKENIKELGGVLTGINKNLKQNEDFEMKKQMVMFEKLLKIVDVSLINRSLAKEILEKSLSNFINISTKSGNELQNILFEKVNQFLFSILSHSMNNSNDEVLLFDKMKNYEELIKNLVKSGINFKKDLKCQKKILQILTISEKLKSDTLTGY